MERIQKIISQAGLASRRRAEEFIKSGQVLINGKKAKLGDKADINTDTIKVYGKTLKMPEEKIYLALNKPQKYLCTKTDSKGRKTIYALVPKEIRNKIWNVGRLDFDTEGLILLTNDGELTQQLTHPKFEHEKEYEVTVKEAPNAKQIEKLKKGVVLKDGSLTSPAQVKIQNNKIFITIHEGKNHQVKNMFSAIGLPLTHLKRIRVGKLFLPENLGLGKYQQVFKNDIV